MPPKHPPRHQRSVGALPWLWLSLAVLLLDWATKQAALFWLEPYQPVAVAPMFNLMLAFNPGAAFSFLADAGGWQRWFFTGLALVVAVAITVWLARLPRGERWTAAALALILGGALGNAWDRIRHGHVVDFIDLYYGQWHWPAFNIADSAITVGAAIIVVLALRGEKS